MQGGEIKETPKLQKRLIRQKQFPTSKGFFPIKIHFKKVKIGYLRQTKLNRKTLQFRFPSRSDYKHDIWQLWSSASQVAIVSLLSSSGNGGNCPQLYPLFTKGKVSPLSAVLLTL